LYSSHDITVIVTSYNESATIRDCLISILEQNYPPKSIIVIDDFSNDIDLTSNIIRSLNKIYKIQIDLIVNNKNIGPGLSRNKAWQFVKTDLVGFLDADDLYFQNKLKYQIEIFNNFPKVSIVSGNKLLNKKISNSEVNISKIKNLNFYKLLFFNDIATSSVLIKSNLKNRFLHTYYSEDYYLWLLTLYEKNLIIHIDSNLCSQNFKYIYKNNLSSNFLKMEIGIQRAISSYYSKNFYLILLLITAQIFSILKLIRRFFIK